MGDGLQEPIANLIDDQILTLILVMTADVYLIMLVLFVRINPAHL